MLAKLISVCVFAVCNILGFIVVEYLSKLVADEREWSNTEGFIIISPIIVIHLIFGFLNKHFSQIIFYALTGAVLLTVGFYIEEYFYPAQTSDENDILYLAYNSPFPYALILFGMGVLASLCPLIIGWCLGLLRR